MKEAIIKDLREFWDFIKYFLIASGVLFWIFVIVIKVYA